MFDFIFETRNKNVASLIKLGDLLGRSLRENLTLFTINTETKTVSYITENKKIITGTYLLEDNKIHLTNIDVEDSSLFDNTENINPIIEGKINNFVNNLSNDDFASADNSFQDLLDSWELKYKFEKKQKDFNNRIKQFNESQNIITSDSFKKITEITPKLVEFLKENKDKINKVVEINNSIKLSNIISKAFNLTKVNLDNLKEITYNLTEEIKPVYDMICRQELLKKELLESKKDFEAVWATNNKLQNLAGNIFSKDIEQPLVEAIKEVPYIALASKKDLYNVISNSLDLNENISVTPKDLKNYVSKLFELKKPIKQRLIDLLSEKYHINVANLKDPPSFGSLINTQVVVFESLAKLSTKGTVQKQILAEFAKELKNKAGIQSLDLNDYIQKLFNDAGLNNVNENTPLLQFLDFEKIAQNLASVTNVLQLLKTVNPGGGLGQQASTAYQGEDPAGVPPTSNVPGASNMDQESGEMSNPVMDADDVPTDNVNPTGLEQIPNSNSLNTNMSPTKVDMAQLMMQMKEIQALMAQLGLSPGDMTGDEEFDDEYNPVEGDGMGNGGMGGEMGDPGMEMGDGEGEGEESFGEEEENPEEEGGDQKPKFGGKEKSEKKEGSPKKKEKPEKKEPKKKE